MQFAPADPRVRGGHRHRHHPHHHPHQHGTYHTSIEQEKKVRCRLREERHAALCVLMDRELLTIQALAAQEVFTSLVDLSDLHDIIHTIPKSNQPKTNYDNNTNDNNNNKKDPPPSPPPLPLQTNGPRRRRHRSVHPRRQIHHPAQHPQPQQRCPQTPSSMFALRTAVTVIRHLVRCSARHRPPEDRRRVRRRR